MAEFSQDLFDKICSRIADGESLRAICREKDMPSQVSVFRWLKAEENEELRKQYTRAREDQADAIFDECIDIADSVAAPEDIPKARLMIDTRKWMAGKLRPKVYGDVSRLEHSGPDGGPIEVASANDMTDDELASIAKAGSN